MLYPNRIEHLREFIINSGSHEDGMYKYEGMSTFSSRNILGDPMETIYCNEGIIVDYCPGYDYLEIFGLNDKEYLSLLDILDIQDGECHCEGKIGQQALIRDIEYIRRLRYELLMDKDKCNGLIKELTRGLMLIIETEGRGK